MGRKRVAVLFGGQSPEHEISLMSAFSVIKNLDLEKFEIVPIGITKAGKWFHYSGSSELILNGAWENEKENCVPVGLNLGDFEAGFLKFEENLKVSKLLVDCVFPVIHGDFGEDGKIQGLLECAKIPYVGCSVFASACCMDKAVTHILLNNAGIKVTDWVQLKKSCLKDLNLACEDVLKRLSFPIFVKPANAGSSIGISRCTDFESFKVGILEAFKFDDKLICEAEVVGQEVECAVLGNEILSASVLGEIKSCNEFYDYDAKYENESGLKIPADLSEEVSQRVREIAVKAYEVLGCCGLSRVDFLISEAGDIFLNEINTMPGFTRISMYPKLWEKSGISYKDLLTKLVELAIF